MKSKEIIFHCFCRLDSTSLCPYAALCVIPNISLAYELAIEIWRVEVVDAQVEDYVSLVRRRDDRGCHLCNL